MIQALIGSTFGSFPWRAIAWRMGRRLARPTDVLMQTVDQEGNVSTPVRQAEVIPVQPADMAIASFS